MDIIRIVSNLKEISVLYKKYRLMVVKRDFRGIGLDDIKKIDKEKITTTKINYNKKIKIQLVNFHRVLKENFNEKDLNNFYINANSLNVLIYNIRNIQTMGEYDPIYNKIRIYENNNTVIYHELFHIASNTLSKKGDYTGFCRKKGNYCIGLGINEGYTEYLTQKYFGEISDCYEFEVFVSNKLEKIIGKDKMKSLYLNSDLYGLIEELSKYSNKKSIENFLLRLDHYTLRYNTNFISDRERKFIKSLSDHIIDFLIKCYDNKIDLDNSISSEEKNRRKFIFEKEIMDEIYDIKQESKSK